MILRIKKNANAFLKGDFTMARPKGNHKRSIHIYVDDSVYDYIESQTLGIQSISSYLLQRSGIIPEYRNWSQANAITGMPAPAPIMQARTCDTCLEIQCDPSCPMLGTRTPALHTY